MGVAGTLHLLSGVKNVRKHFAVSLIFIYFALMSSVFGTPKSGMQKAILARCFSLFAAVAMLAVSLPVSGQVNGWQEYCDILLEENDEDEESAALVYEQLSDIASHPVNLNAVSREDLEAMYFFDSRQVDAILDYVSHYGPVRSKGELSMIPFLDAARSGLLACLTFLGEMPECTLHGLDSLMFRAGAAEFARHVNASAKGGELVASARIPFYERRGDRSGYVGYKYRHWLRFNYAVDSHLKVGAVAAQDAGEPFFFGKNKWGYDYYSAYLQVKRRGFLENLVVGNYRMRTALGLVMNSSLGFGKSFGTGTLHSPASVLTPHTSRSSAAFLQGAAATFAVSRQLKSTVFASLRRIDASLDEDGNIVTVLKTGYHRTASELERKNNASQASAGANVEYRGKAFRVGATALWNHYNRPMKPWKNGSPVSQLYRRYYPSGTDFFNASVNYGYSYGKTLVVEGETAADGNGCVATVNTLKWQPHRRLSVTGIQRYYPYKFCATLGRSFSEGGSNRNENGIYVGAEWQTCDWLSLSGYSDAAYFQWPRYGTTGSGHSFDNQLQAVCKLSPSSTLLLRFRVRLCEKDDNTAQRLRYRHDRRMRAAYTVVDGRFSWKTQVDVSWSQFTSGSLGGMVGETAVIAVKPWKIVVVTAYFRTKDYYSRVYAYERSTPYNMSFMSFFGHGCRAYALAEVSLPLNLTAVAKLGFTRYFDRDTIGSSLQTIDSPSQTDLDIMLMWRI